jgi:hypothetical protein
VAVKLDQTWFSKAVMWGSRFSIPKKSGSSREDICERSVLACLTLHNTTTVLLSMGSPPTPSLPHHTSQHYDENLAAAQPHRIPQDGSETHCTIPPSLPSCPTHAPRKDLQVPVQAGPGCSPVTLCSAAVCLAKSCPLRTHAHEHQAMKAIPRRSDQPD